jgi:tricorn protease
MDRGVLCSFSSDGNKLLYCRKGRPEYQWKRYKGGQYQDIWLYDFPSKQFTSISDYVGKNSYPMWFKDDMVFVSDRDNGVSNLYFQDLKTKSVKALTNYEDFDVMWPASDGTRVVYVQDGYINLFDLNAGKNTKLAIQANSDRWLIRNRTINPKKYIQYSTISNDGKTIAMEARGDIFTVSTCKSGETFNLSKTPGTRERYPQISPDGKLVAFFSDKSGEYQLYVQDVNGGDWRQMTDSLDRTNYELHWAPDSKKVLFGNKDFTIYVLDVSTKRLTKVDSSNRLKNDQFSWKISDYNWSPDSQWVTYSLVQSNRNSQIFLYNVKTGKRHAVTGDFFDNINPVFDADGNYLYYLSSRNFDVQMDFYEDNHVISNPQQVMCVQLRAGAAPPFSDEAKAGKKNSAAAGAMRIDVEGIQDRTFPLPVKAGNYFFLKAGKGKVLFCSVPKFTENEYEYIFEPGRATKWNLHIFDMNAESEVVLPKKIRNFALSSNGEHILVESKSAFFGGTVAAMARKKAFGKAVGLEGMVYTVDYMAEWNQILSDTWRWYRDFFYDAGMHGHDWKKIGETYRALIPYMTSRRHFNWLLSQMVGELCVGHAYIGGGDYGPLDFERSKVFTGLLGADLEHDNASGFYRFARIYGPTEHNRDLKAPLYRPDINIKKGDYLIAIDDVPLKAGDDYFKLLQVVPGQKVKITVNRQPTQKGAKSYRVEPIRRDRRLRYFHWLTGNINKVLKATNGRVGYMHINAMGAGGIGEFDKFWRAFRYKDGIIIDVRRNSGGWTEYFMIDKLERRMVAYNTLNGMVPFRYPNYASNGKFVVVSNEDNGSDGEAFVQHFKARKLGTVVGVPSWGGLVGIINGQRTIDNGIVHQPNNGFYGKEGTWWVENHGADPDVLIDNDPASVMAGKDLQLEKAIEIILKQMADDPYTFPEKPPYPKR